MHPHPTPVPVQIEAPRIRAVAITATLAAILAAPDAKDLDREADELAYLDSLAAIVDPQARS